MHKKRIIVPLLIFLVFLIVPLTYFRVLGGMELWAADALYTKEKKVNNTIKIIAIDEKSLAAYGPFGAWSRQTAADLVNMLNNDKGKPDIIAFDITYIGELDQAGDSAFAEAVKNSGNVILASNVIFKEALRTDIPGSSYINLLHPQSVELPYTAVSQYAKCGFSNTVQDSDNYIRSVIRDIDYGGETVYSFAYQIYRTYQQNHGQAVYVPQTDSNRIFGFSYAAPPSSYETYSFLDVVNGRYDPRLFQDAVVLVGAYVSGMQDQYLVPIARNAVMAGVEIHANIIDALLRADTFVPLNIIVSAAVNFILALLFLLILLKSKFLYHLLALVSFLLLYLTGAVICYRNGFLVYPAALPVFLTIMFIVRLVFSYFSEVVRKHRILSAFKKYIPPQVVDKLSQKGKFQIKLGGELRDIAVLFVDIRGFTPLSEELSPEAVVEVLNDYLALTTKAIFHYEGTLDKYIGDAAMAIFNAPFDLDDYVYRAVQSAKDIAAGGEQLKVDMERRFGKKIGFGIGIHCGNAVIGNIGCDYRMDYTAIGNTVNTAARLESIAKSGQILISEEVYQRLEGRIQATKVGHIPLKGKLEDILVYQVDQLKEEQEIGEN